MLKGLSFPAKPLVCLQQVKGTWSAAWMFCQWKRRWFYIYFIWWPFWTPSLTLVSWTNTQRSYLALQRRHTQTQQQRPEWPTVTLTWHASKYKALNSILILVSSAQYRVVWFVVVVVRTSFWRHQNVLRHGGNTSKLSVFIQVTEEIQVDWLQSFLKSVVFTSVGLTFWRRIPVTILLPQASLSGTLPAFQLSFWGTIRFPIPSRHANHRFPYHSGVTILAFQQALEFEFAEFENPSLYSKHRFPAPSFPL